MEALEHELGGIEVTQHQLLVELDRVAVLRGRVDEDLQVLADTPIRFARQCLFELGDDGAEIRHLALGNVRLEIDNLGVVRFGAGGGGALRRVFRLDFDQAIGVAVARLDPGLRGGAGARRGCSARRRYEGRAGQQCQGREPTELSFQHR